VLVLAAALAAAQPATPREPVAARPAGIANARVESRSAAAGLAAVVQAELGGRQAPAWLAWSVPTALGGSACCYSGREGGPACAGCRLDGDGFAVEDRADSEPLERSGRLRVLLRLEGAFVRRVRAFSEECPLDFAGLPLVLIEDVRPAESVALLSGLVAQPRAGRSGRTLDEGALSAIALHADASADAALDRFVAREQPLELRRQAAFWLGQARGAHGYEVLRRLVRDDEDSRFREHAVFSLSQSREPGAVDAIVAVAKRDPDGHVRGQALFWLAQTAARRAPGTIQAALDDDPEVEVKKKAVFALSQLPRDEGVPLLIGVARSHRNPEVRRQAMFWLGQSRDPRALAFFEDVLGR
jgi:HEAT repeat protein